MSEKTVDEIGLEDCGFALMKPVRRFMLSLLSGIGGACMQEVISLSDSSRKVKQSYDLARALSLR